MIPFKHEFFSWKTADHRQLCCRLLVMVCLSAALVTPNLFAQESAGKVASQSKSWLARIISQSEAASARAEVLLTKAKASVANSRNIQARAMSSDNSEIKARARKALLNAEALQKKALADLLASRSALAVLRGGLPVITSGTPLVFVTLGQDARYTPGNRAKPAATAFYGIVPGDHLETGIAGKALLHLLDDGLESEIQLGSNARLVVQNDEGDDATMQLVVQQGSARITDTAQTPEAQAAVDKRKSVLDSFFNCLEKKKMDYSACAYGHLVWMRRVEVRTPSAVCAVRGTEYVLAHDEAAGVTILKVLEGEVALLSDRHGQALLVSAGQGARAEAAGLGLLESGVDVAAEKLLWEE